MNQRFIRFGSVSLGWLALLLTSLFVGTWVDVAMAIPVAADGYNDLTFSDEFNGTSMDTNKWEHRALGLRRDAINTAEAVSVQNGYLTITTYTDAAGDHRTGMIGSQSTFLQTHGYFETRVRFHTGPGQWSAFWLQSPTMGNPLGDPATAGTEIDVIEHRQVTNSGVNIEDDASHAVHWDGYGANHQAWGRTTSPAGLANDVWKTVGLLWDDDEYTFFIDDVQVEQYTGVAISQRSEYLILSSEVENDSWAGFIPGGGYGLLGNSTTRFDVDYVRVYAFGEAVPEPGTAGLVAWTIATLALRRQRRNRRRKNICELRRVGKGLSRGFSSQFLMG